MRQERRNWTAEEDAALRAGVQVGDARSKIALRLGRSENAVVLRMRRCHRDLLTMFDPANAVTAMDRWGKGRPARGKYWTAERCRAALAAYIEQSRGMLPRDYSEYWSVKSGRPDLPTWHSVKPLRQKYGPTLGHVWLGLGAPLASVHTLGGRWTKREESLLLELAGTYTLKAIAHRLHRSYAACRRKLYDYGTKARNNQGYMSAQQVADEYGCEVHRVLRLIHAGKLRARLRNGNRYEIDPMEAERKKAELTAPKKTLTGAPTPVGEYRQRYGITRRSEGAA